MQPSDLGVALTWTDVLHVALCKESIGMVKRVAKECPNAITGTAAVSEVLDDYADNISSPMFLMFSCNRVGLFYAYMGAVEDFSKIRIGDLVTAIMGSTGSVTRLMLAVGYVSKRIDDNGRSLIKAALLSELEDIGTLEELLEYSSDITEGCERDIIAGWDLLFGSHDVTAWELEHPKDDVDKI